MVPFSKKQHDQVKDSLQGGREVCFEGVRKGPSVGGDI